MGFFATANARLTNGMIDTLHAANAAAKHRLYRRKVYRATLRELSSLSDRDLADLGLRRGMLRGLAKEAARRA